MLKAYTSVVLGMLPIPCSEFNKEYGRSEPVWNGPENGKQRNFQWHIALLTHVVRGRGHVLLQSLNTTRLGRTLAKTISVDP